MKKNILSCIFALSVFMITAQNEARKWYFGTNAGLDFSTNPPTVLTNGAMNTYEGCASISDSQGNLLFYTDGITVYDQTHAVMANGTGLSGSGSSTQSAIIVKKTGSSSIYYIFTETDVAGIDGLRYSEVDMSLAAGMGSVTTKNYALFTPSCEKLTAVRHCNGIDTWVVSHDWNSANFRTYLVTAAGVSLTPVISNSGASITGAVSRTLGQMKISPNGKKLGLTIFDVTQSPFEIYDFNAATGVVSNPLVLGNSTNSYGCEFSPDGTKFYGGSFSGSKFFQWDLCAGTTTAIIASQATIAVGFGCLGSFQLATDGKIYMARCNTAYLSVINSPNMAGTACNFVDVGLSIGTGTCQLGLPNFINSFFKEVTPFTYTSSCSTYSFNAPPTSTMNAGCGAIANVVTGYLWDFGDPASGPANLSLLSDPVHTYPGPGTYTAGLILYNACSSDTLRSVLTHSTTSPNLTIAGSFTVCKGDDQIYTVSGANSYTWNTGAHTTTLSPTPTVTTTYSVTGTGTNSCVGSKVFTVTVDKCSGITAATGEDHAFAVYPNPTAGNLFIETASPVKFKLINQFGQIVVEGSFESGKHTIDLNAFNNGIYSARFFDGTHTQTTRIVKVE